MTQELKPDTVIEIVDYHSRWAGRFRDLNYQWLEKYFEIEPYDRIILNDPNKQIIKLGGQILFARLRGEIVGTCAILKHAEKKYELAKMGVEESYRRNGIGRRLALAAIDRAHSLGADKIVLATSPQLTAANHLYESLGFKYVDISEIGPLPYKRESVVMELKL